MNIVTDNLQQIIDAPDGIKRLRELILQLAVQGKLVEQRPEEGTAVDLLKQIEKAKAADLKKRKANGERVIKSKQLPPISSEEIPFDIPESWEWVRLGQFATISGGYAYKSELFNKKGNNQVLRLGNVKPDFIRINQNSVFIDDILANQTSEYCLKAGDILITMTGTRKKRDYLYTASIVENPLRGVTLYLNQRLGCIRNLTKSSWLNTVLKSEKIKDPVFARATGTANQANVGIAALREWCVSLPPLPEQKRIVAKVDELMRWCDELEELKQRREALRIAALESSLLDLTAQGGKAATSRIFDNFADLIRSPEDVKQMRDAILQLAVQGRLVEQRPEEGTAADLLKQIAKAKAADQKQRKANGERVSKGKSMPPISTEEIPFEIPENWEWVRIRSIFSDIGQKIPDEKFCYVDVSAINKERGIITADDVKILEPADAPSRARKLVCRGSVIYSTVRPYLLNIAVIEDDFAHEPIVSTAFAVLKPWAGTSERLLYYYLRSPVFTGYVEAKQKGVAYPAISESEFNLGPYPLPPLPEQKRIVAKVDELMGWCDELEALLTSEAATAARFAAAVAKGG